MGKLIAQTTKTIRAFKDLDEAIKFHSDNVKFYKERGIELTLAIKKDKLEND